MNHQNGPVASFPARSLLRIHMTQPGVKVLLPLLPHAAVHELRHEGLLDPRGADHRAQDRHREERLPGGSAMRRAAGSCAEQAEGLGSIFGRLNVITIHELLTTTLSLTKKKKSLEK